MPNASMTEEVYIFSSHNVDRERWHAINPYGLTHEEMMRVISAVGIKLRDREDYYHYVGRVTPIEWNCSTQSVWTVFGLYTLLHPKIREALGEDLWSRFMKIMEARGDQASVWDFSL